MVEPIATMFTVPTGFNFEDPKCAGINFICWPTVGASSVEHYRGGKGRVPGWDRVLLITTLKRGSLYVLPLTADGKKAAGAMSRYWQAENRYRDTAVHPDGRTIYAATDPGGMGESYSGGATTNMEDKGAILAFTYAGEGAPETVGRRVISQGPGAAAPGKAVAGAPPRFTARQVTGGKKAYDSYCAVCHGSTLTNGTFGTPLAGAYFRSKWGGRSVADFYEKSHETMPPAAPRSLPKESYANIVAYVLEVNGYKAGGGELPAGGEALKQMRIQ
jgi:mono/diheme cytochrome c family protein